MEYNQEIFQQVMNKSTLFSSDEIDLLTHYLTRHQLQPADFFVRQEIWNRRSQMKYKLLEQNLLDITEENVSSLFVHPERLRDELRALKQESAEDLVASKVSEKLEAEDRAVNPVQKSIAEDATSHSAQNQGTDQVSSEDDPILYFKKIFKKLNRLSK